MALTVQNLRAVGSGVEPNSLLPGQIAFNITDKVIYVGDGSNFKTNYDGTQVPGVTGGGWYAMPMDFDALGDYYVANPAYYGDIPTDQQVLAWSTALNHPIWITGTGGGGSQVYVVTNAQVAAAPGATTSDKITAAIGVASPDEGNVTIVTGLPDDVYEGLYFFAPTSWVKGAAYAYPSASEVIYNNTGRTLGATVQAAIDDLDDGLIATTAIANTANSTATAALAIASAALPRSGGTMTGTIVSQNINVQSGFGVQFSAGVNGTIDGINDSINAPSSTVAASGTAVKTAYDIGAAALPRTGGTMTGTITFAAGQIFPVSGNYGSFVRTTTQTNADTTNGNAVSFDTTVASNNFSLVGGTQITAAVAGTYSVIAAYQVQKTDSGTDDINVWFKKNGANVANSAFSLTLVGNGAAQLATTPWIITLAAGDYIEAWWWSTDVNAQLLGEPAAAPYPAIPAVNLVIMPVGA